MCKNQTALTLNLTSFLHKDKEIIKKLLPLWVIIQFIKLYVGKKTHQQQAPQPLL